jgi:hypothetical protein
LGLRWLEHERKSANFPQALSIGRDFSLQLCLAGIGLVEFGILRFILMSFQSQALLLVTMAVADDILIKN